jgi:hypothetical protein
MDADHRFYRTIRGYDRDSNVKVTQSELVEFLRIANATFESSRLIQPVLLRNAIF